VPDDRLVVAHSFSKSFLMTGWRLGWLVLPRGHLDAIGKLIEFNTSCAPVFVQRGALAGLAMADDFVPGLVQRLQACRDRLVAGLQALPGVQVATPPGGMYAFFRVQGEDDSLAFAKRLVTDHGLGLAPGVAFGDEGEGWLRWCFASRDPARLDQGLHRLAGALRYNPGSPGLGNQARHRSVSLVSASETGNRSRRWGPVRPVAMAVSRRRGNLMTMTTAKTAEIVSRQRPRRQRHRLPRSAGRAADRAHQRTHAALQAAPEGPPRPPRPAEDGQPAQAPAVLPEGPDPSATPR
jgi:hypothetical protein